MRLVRRVATVYFALLCGTALAAQGARLARYAPATSPLWPPPMTIAS